MAHTVAELVAEASHAGPLDGAPFLGEASGGERLVVRIGYWESGGRVTRARFRATTCASLIAFAEAACRLLEGGAEPGALDAAALRDAVRDVHAVHRDRASLVAAAVGAARHGGPRGAPP